VLTGFNVSINDEIGAWHDFVTGAGGGELALICHVRDGSRAEALGWLASMLGVTLDSRPLSRTDRQRYAQALQDAPELARVAGLWYTERREDLERRKAQALSREDWAALETAAREHYLLGILSGAGIVRVYLRARQVDPAGTAALVAEGERWARVSEALVTLLIAHSVPDPEAA
jgi:hypothetical protein